MVEKRYFVCLFIVILSLFTACKKKPVTELPMSDISYGSHSKQKMDIYLPPGMDEGNNVPIAFFIHGGSWIEGDKKDFDYIKGTVLNNNFAYVTINYRLLGDNATYREMLEDINSAILFLRDNGEKYNLKTDRMVMFGNSAGGHLGLLYAYSYNSPVDIAFVASQVGPTDFTDPGQISLNGREKLSLMNRLLNTRVSAGEIEDTDFSFPEVWYSASPVYNVKSTSVPTILAYGMNDDLVSFTNAERLNDKLEEHNVYHRLIAFPNSGHGLNNDPDKTEEYFSVVNDFLQAFFYN